MKLPSLFRTSRRLLRHTVDTAMLHTQRMMRSKKQRIVVGIGAIIVIAGGIGITIEYATRSQASTKHPPLEVVNHVPFKTLTPNGVAAQKLGGWRRISPPGSDAVYAYSDSLSDVAITVSEQQLPSSLNGDTSSKLADLAAKFNATDRLDVKGATVYIGTSAKGPQSVIIVKNDVLVLIKSKNKIDDIIWVAYIKSLQ